VTITHPIIKSTIPTNPHKIQKGFSLWDLYEGVYSICEVCVIVFRFMIPTHIDFYACYSYFQIKSSKLCIQDTALTHLFTPT
jgi:hypothetical protein